MTYPGYEPTAPLGGGLRALEASAGTGKTHAVTSTVLRLVVEEALPLDEVLLVTFTRAAAAELGDRLRSRLADGAVALAAAAAGEASDDDLLRWIADRARDGVGLADAQQRVETALRTVDQATVTTIHGFCHQVLRQAAVAADADPGVALDTDDDRLVTAVVDDWLIAFTHGHDERLLALMGALGLGRDELLAIGRTVAGEPGPELAPASPLAVAVDDVLAAEATVRAALSTADLTIAAARAAKDDGVIDGNDRHAPRAGRLLGRIDKVREAFESGGSPQDEVLGKLDPAGDEGDGTREMPAPIAATPLPQAVGALRSLRVAFETSVRRSLADHVLVELAERRDRAGTASFADLLRHLDRALAGPDGDTIVREVGASYRAVFVDEFQDTDPVQWRILSRLFGRAHVFDVVGDPKQAIYGWRGADLETYKRARDRAGDRTYTMERNWRSDRAYVAACNALLHREGSLGDPDVEYVPVDTPEHHDRRLVDDDDRDVAGLRLVHLRGVGDESRPTAVVRVAEEVAEDLVRTLGAGLRLPVDDGATGGATRRSDADGRRPVVAADCAVLVRRHSEATAVAEALRRRDVAVVVGGGRDVLRSAEAGAVADLLRSLLRPSAERALHRVLVGPLVGLTGSELADLPDDQRQSWYERIATWAETWRDGGVAAALQRAIREGEAEVRHAGQRDGDRTMTNIRHLSELLHDAEQEEALGVHALAAWFDARRAEAEDEDTPPERELRLERDDAAVRVVTVHAAKGLEYPLVWVPFLWMPEGRNDGSAPFVVNDPANGNARTVALHASSSGALRARGERARLRTAYDRSEWESGLRLAYVALTRAVHRCTVHLVAESRGRAVTRSPAWQLLWAPRLGSGAPDVDGDDRPAVDEDEMIGVLRTLAEDPPVTLEVVADECGVTRLVTDAGGTGVDLDVRRWQRSSPLEVRWGRASFTGLLRRRARPVDVGADDGDEVDRDQAADRQADALAPIPPTVCSTDPQVPLARVPRGAAWGTYLHAVLEEAPFDAPVDELRRLADGLADRAGLRPSEDELEAVATGLHAALRTPLGPALGDLQLARLGRRDRLDELEFTLALGQDASHSTTVGRIADVLERHDAATDAPLAAAARHLRAGGAGVPVHGLLVGAIDLVLRHEGRFWIADYKSNGLGQWVEDGDGRRWCETERHTTPERVRAAMLHGDYLLQAHLYVVALHRYLRARLGGAYAYDEHVGGWAYLFLRGMTGPDVARTDDLPHGVLTGRPTRALVEDLDAVLRGEAPS